MTTREIVLEMLNEIPKPDGYKMPAGASDSETDAFEGRTGLKTPSPVREWLKTVNGAVIGPGGTYGIHPRETWLDIESFLNNFPGWVQHGWIPMAGDGTGNHYVVATETSREPTGVVFFIDTMALGDEPTYIVASDIWHFLRGLFSVEMGEDWWPFEEGQPSKPIRNLSGTQTSINLGTCEPGWFGSYEPTHDLHNSQSQGAAAPDTSLTSRSSARAWMLTR